MMKKVPADLQNLNEKIQDAKKREHIDSEKIESSPYAKASGLGFQISIELIAATFVGVSVGYFLDEVFDTKPFLFIVFLLAGGAAGFLNAYRTAKNFENQKD